MYPVVPGEHERQRVSLVTHRVEAVAFDGRGEIEGKMRAASGDELRSMLAARADTPSIYFFPTTEHR